MAVLRAAFVVRAHMLAVARNAYLIAAPRDQRSTRRILRIRAGEREVAGVLDPDAARVYRGSVPGGIFDGE